MNIMFFLTPKSETVYEELGASMRQVAERMDYHRLTAIPIIDEKGVYIGTLTEGDLLRMLKNNPEMTFKDTSKISIGDIPRKIVHKTAPIDVDIENIIELARTQNFVPVTDDEGVYIGIIKRGDIIDYCYKTMINKPEKVI
ncbi:MAG: CBS domain-containing protein [Clostridiaceae bacterium]